MEDGGFHCVVYEGATHCGECVINKNNLVRWVDFDGEVNRCVVYAAACAVAVDAKLKAVEIVLSSESEGAIRSARVLANAGFNHKGLECSRVALSLPTDSVKLAAFVLKYLPEFTIEKVKPTGVY